MTDQSEKEQTTTVPDHRIVHARRPGRGWSHVAGAVYDHDSGMRLHLLGYLRMPDGRWLCGNAWPEVQRVSLAMHLTGQTGKRMLMVWAILVLREISWP